MGTCAGFRTCDACNLSEYNQTFEFKVIVSNADRPANLKDSIDLKMYHGEEDRSWWNFEKLLDSDKSWEFKDSK